MNRVLLPIYTFVILAVIMACKPTASSELLALRSELKETKAALEEMEALKELESATETIKDAIEPLKALNGMSPSFDHMVFLNIKDDLSKEEKKTLMAELKALEEIDEVEAFEIGRFKDVGDARALSDYELVMKMSFENKKAYQTYQDHPKHLNLKKKLGEFLAGPPAVYDYRY